MIDEQKIKEQIVQIATRCYDRGLLVAGDGNISVRVGENRCIATPSAVSKGWMTPEMMVTVDLDGLVAEVCWEEGKVVGREAASVLGCICDSRPRLAS